MRASTSTRARAAAYCCAAHVQLGERTRRSHPVAARADPNDPYRRPRLLAGVDRRRPPEEAVQELEEAHASAPTIRTRVRARVGIPAAQEARRRAAVRRGLGRNRWRHLRADRPHISRRRLLRPGAQRSSRAEKDPRSDALITILGTLSVLSEGVLRLDEAIAEFRQELKLAPSDPVTNLRLGMALVEAQRHGEALPALRIAARADGRSGRRVSLPRPVSVRSIDADAIRIPPPGARAGRRLRRTTYRALACALPARRALRELGAEEAARHFERGGALLGGGVDQSASGSPGIWRTRPVRDPGALRIRRPLAALPRTTRPSCGADIREALTRGVLQPWRDPRAGAALHARGRVLRATRRSSNPVFPQVQYSLGVALFNAEAIRQGHRSAHARDTPHPRTRTSGGCSRSAC